MRRIPIHIKLTAALLVPLVALIVFVTFEVVESYRVANDVDQQAGVVKAATGPNGLFNALQDERNKAALSLIGQDDLVQVPCDDNADCRAVTDRSLDNFREQVKGESADVQQIYDPAFTKLEELKALRQDADNVPGPYSLDTLDVSEQIFDRYSEIIDELNESRSAVATAIDHPELRRGADLSDIASRNTDVLARLVAELLEASVRSNPAEGNELGLDTPKELDSVGSLFGLHERHFRTLEDLSTGGFKAAGTKFVDETNATGIRELVPQFIETGQINQAGLLESVSIDRDTSYYGFRDDVKNIVESRADELSADAGQRARMFSALAICAVIVAAMATWVVSRSITRPLRALTRQAADMANHRLPDAVLDILDTPLGDDVTVPQVEPVRVATKDEVADVADALNVVQDSALDLAVEQAMLRRNIADSFVNLGRRNQNLLGRQLDFITELEHNETNPDTLANLFRLDHLATRMRRNAESLLVLAGIDPPRKWAAPVRITDAIRAALGEVEDYQRVMVRAVEPVTVLGSAAADLAHLLAELIENALIFSPPDQTVEIRGRSQPTGYTLAVIDAGLGMPPDELERANRRLAGAESFTIAPSKYLGHYVAGHLASRHAVQITMHGSPGKGITVTINLPPALLTEAAAEPEPAQSAQFDELLQPPMQAAPEPMTVPDTTHSGLVKRTPQNVGRTLPTTQPAQTPDADLLQTLAQHTSQLQQVDAPPPGQPLPPRSQPQQAPPPGPGPPPPQPQPDFSGPPTQPNPTRLPSPPPGPPPGAPPGPPPGPAPFGPPPGSAPPPGPFAPPAPEVPQPQSPTPSGLTRRVRGAQLPSTQTSPLRRGENSREEPAAAEESDDSDGDRAQEVYNFLSDFTAGIQRGLDSE